MIRSSRYCNQVVCNGNIKRSVRKELFNVGFHPLQAEKFTGRRESAKARVYQDDYRAFAETLVEYSDDEFSSDPENDEVKINETY
jgi:hypothetical protein